MAEEKRNIVYSAADIQQYLAGKMTAAQMHALEKAALDDPLLADAIEGYEAVQENDWANQLQSLKEKFSASEDTPVIAINQKQRYKWWKAAAAVIVIGGSVTVAYLFTKEKSSDTPQIASVTPATDSAKKMNTPVFADSVSTTYSANDLARNETTISEDTKNAGSYYDVENAKTGLEKQLLSNKDAGRADSSFVYTPNGETAKELKPESGGGYRDDVATAKTNNPSASNNAAEAMQANTQNTEQAAPVLDNYKKEDASDKWANGVKRSGNFSNYNKQFTAQVVSPDNKPVAFANVTILNNRKNTYADVNGNFGIAIPDSVVHVEIKSVGFDTRQYTFRNGPALNKIVLQQQNKSLSEAVVTKSFGKARAKAVVSQAETDSMNIAEPVDGWGNYNSYLTNNLKLPDETIKKDIHGEVEISFDVKNNGTITNVKVDKPLCTNCDEEAVRLIKQGPQWKVKKGRKATAKVKVQF